MKLEFLDSTGLKNLKDCLDEPLEREKKAKTALRSLNYLSFNRCDFITTSKLD